MLIKIHSHVYSYLILTLIILLSFLHISKVLAILSAQANTKKKIFQKIKSEDKTILFNAKFLNERVNTNRKKFKGFIVENQKTVFIEEPVTISDCIFSLCYSDTFDGGAIYTTIPLKIKHCLFSSNFAIKGGSVYSTSTLNVTLTTFINGNSDDGGAIYSYKSPEIILRQVAFTTMQSLNNACTNIQNSSLVFIKHNNVTTASAHYATSGLRIDSKNSTLLYCKFLQCSALTDCTLHFSNGNAFIRLCKFSLTKALTMETSSIILFEAENKICAFDRCFIKSIKSDKVPPFRIIGDSKIFISNLYTNFNISSLIHDSKIYFDEQSRKIMSDNLNHPNFIHTFVGFDERLKERKREYTIDTIKTSIFVFFVSILSTFFGLFSICWCTGGYNSYLEIRKRSSS